MREKGLDPDFPKDALQQLERIEAPAREKDPVVRDLRDLLWASIDNDDSRDLDQLSVAEELAGGAVKVLVAIADVDALVKKGNPARRAGRAEHDVGLHGRRRLPDAAREALDGPHVAEPGRGPARRRRRIRRERGRRRSATRTSLAPSCATRRSSPTTRWTRGATGAAQMPEAMARVPGIDAQIRLQEDVSQRLRRLRYAQGALDLQTIEARAVFDGEEIRDLTVDEENQPKQLIEDFMIAANGVTARYLEEAGFAALRRIVRSPERWQRIVSVAAEYGFSLPEEPDSKALEEFLAARRKADPLRFPDLSLVIVKLMGAGEYVVELPGREPVGHFGLAVQRLHALHRAESPVPRRDHAAPPEGRARTPPVALFRLRAERPRRPLHGAGGRREQGRAPRAQVRGRAPPRDAHRRALRRGRDRARRRRARGCGSSGRPWKARSCAARRGSRSGTRCA